MSDLLEMKHISKSFAKNKVLEDVSFSVKAGEVHALLGENGAGKSTLLKILGGVYLADGGEIYIDGQKAEFSNVVGSQECGVSILHQELMLMPHLSIADNIFLGREKKTGLGLLDKKEQLKRTQELLDSFGLPFSAGTMLGKLTIAQQQMVEIIRAVSFHAKLIAMDEPTSSLSEHETEILFQLIETLKKQNIGIIFISHRFNDIFSVCDRITVLRDGNCIGTVETKQTNEDELITMMVGRDISEFYSKKERKDLNETLLKVEHLSDGDKVKDVSFTLKKGEILGVSGLVGAGRSETMKCIFGLSKRTGGTVTMEGKEVHYRIPEQAMQDGVGYVCEDRKVEGLFLKQDVRYNTSINVLGQFLKLPYYNRRKEEQLAAEYAKRLATKITGINQITRFLSGGNQQKVLISRWLACTSKILILDEPTRGVDVKTKQDIYQLIGDLTEQGLSIIFVSSELAELINVCDRITVFSNGKTTGTLGWEEFDQEAIMKLATKEFSHGDERGNGI